MTTNILFEFGCTRFIGPYFIIPVKVVLMFLTVEGSREKPTQAMGDHVNPTQRNLHAVGQKSLEDCWFTISVSEYDSLSSTSGKAPSVLEKGQRANESRIC